jgi:short-subunit dehydrogenase
MSPAPNSKRSRNLFLWEKAGLSAAAAFAAFQLIRKASRKKVDLAEKIVLITGSRGLALALAYEFGRSGSRIVLCARDPEELGRACSALNQENIDAVSFPCDIAEEREIGPLIDRVLEQFGRIDILINSAGDIQVGPLESLQHSDFKQGMDLMFWAPVNLTFAVLPEMKRRGSGCILNITSVGGRVSVPHLLPYSCAKFALVGFSTGLSTELHSSGVHVMTVIPGLMRTGSYLNATFKGNAKQEFAWFGLLGNLPGFSIAADYAARSIRRALERKLYVCTISLPAKILIACEALLPDATTAVLAAASRFLLPEGGSQQTSIGHSLNRMFGQPFQAFTILGRRAARKLNELPERTV